MPAGVTRQVTLSRSEPTPGGEPGAAGLKLLKAVDLEAGAPASGLVLRFVSPTRRGHAARRRGVGGCALCGNPGPSLAVLRFCE